jgi:hypothetical protein
MYLPGRKISLIEKIIKRADNTAWDHEHCELCWATISEYLVHQQEGYTDGKEWLCIECHDKYITPVRST